MIAEHEEYRRLQQVALEDEYGRHNLKKIILSSLEELDPENTTIELATEQVSLYLHTDHGYQSKNDRVISIAEDFSAHTLVVLGLAAAMSSSRPQPIQAVSSRFRAYLGKDDFDTIKTCAEILALLAAADVLDAIAPQASETGSWMIKSNYCFDEETFNKVSMFAYLPPMVCKPNMVTSNIDNSHLGFTKHLVLGKLSEHNMRLNLEAINIANQVELTLDECMLEFDEIPNKELDTIQKVEQFRLMKDTSTSVYNKMLELGNKFHLTWRYDSRGRMYSQGYSINIQSTDFKKSLINLHHKELINL